MNVQQQIARLESLLARIKGNAGKARAASSVLAQPAAAAIEAPDTEEAPESGPPTDRTEVPLRPSSPPTVPPPELGRAEEAVMEPPAAASSARAETRAAESQPVSTVVAVSEMPPADTWSEPPPGELEELDMSDAEIVEIAVDVSPPLPVAADDDTMMSMGGAQESSPAPPPLANELAEEPAPESAPRPAQVGEEADLEPPVKTPPPESGRQVVATPVGITGETELEGTAAGASLEPDLSGGAISHAPGSAPSVSQLGDTVELEGADGPPARIELLSAPMNVEEQVPPPDDLELSLPPRQFGGGYDADLAPPSRAAQDLERHREQVEIRQHPPTEPPASLASPPSFVATEEAAAGSPVLVERPAVGSIHVAEMRKTALTRIPDTFLDLLDASLSIEA